MQLEEALDLVVARTKHEYFRALCDPDHPDFQPGYAHLVIAMATGEETSPAEVPTTAGAVPFASIPLAGDLVAAATARMGVDRLVKYVSDQIGVDCGCPERQEKLNRLDRRLRKWLGL